MPVGSPVHVRLKVRSLDVVKAHTMVVLERREMEIVERKGRERDGDGAREKMMVITERKMVGGICYGRER